MQQIGETREEMRNRLLSKKIYDVSSQAHKEKGLNEFWIIFHHREDVHLCNVIRESITVTDKKPAIPMLSSMCFHVVWDKGIVEDEWILPRDLPYDEEIFGSDGHSELVGQHISRLGSNVLM